MERPNGTALEGFFRPVVHQEPFGGVGALQTGLDARRARHDRERPRPGYRDRGRRPRETVERVARREG